MKLQDKLEGLASTAFERQVIKLWLDRDKARSGSGSGEQFRARKTAELDLHVPVMSAGLPDGA